MAEATQLAAAGAGTALLKLAAAAATHQLEASPDGVSGGAAASAVDTALPIWAVVAFPAVAGICVAALILLSPISPLAAPRPYYGALEGGDEECVPPSPKSESGSNDPKKYVSDLAPSVHSYSDGTHTDPFTPFLVVQDPGGLKLSIQSVSGSKHLFQSEPQDARFAVTKCDGSGPHRELLLLHFNERGREPAIHINYFTDSSVAHLQTTRAHAGAGKQRKVTIYKGAQFSSSRAYATVSRDANKENCFRVVKVDPHRRVSICSSVTSDATPPPRFPAPPGLADRPILYVEIMPSNGGDVLTVINANTEKALARQRPGLPWVACSYSLHVAGGADVGLMVCCLVAAAKLA
eukprot:NODE_12854_length_1200_cov_1.756757.p1 GENE.NODE_12854_length_1200_cov_1.756757~~NODE_12854_length_1200_cov_1.756757.p1  ORF type:complete len:350 (-),score=100.97 NODE_12854_length_1200_cov_1.756757:89-1138(-)